VPKKRQKSLCKGVLHATSEKKKAPNNTLGKKKNKEPKTAGALGCGSPSCTGEKKVIAKGCGGRVEKKILGAGLKGVCGAQMKIEKKKADPKLIGNSKGGL